MQPRSSLLAIPRSAPDAESLTANPFRDDNSPVKAHIISGGAVAFS